MHARGQSISSRLWPLLIALGFEGTIVVTSVANRLDWGKINAWWEK